MSRFALIFVNLALVSGQAVNPVAKACNTIKTHGLESKTLDLTLDPGVDVQGRGVPAQPPTPAEHKSVSLS